MDISIITATYNAGNTLAECLDSLRNQTQPFQHVVVDGLSMDNTLEIVKSQPASSDTIIVSEPDSGIYDAMNKGIQLATGDIIGILNSDDLYADSAVLADVMSLFASSSIDGCYGDLVYVERANIKRVTRYWRSGPYDIRKWYWGWMPPHPTFFVKRAAYQHLGKFNLLFGSAADYELMLRFLLKNKLEVGYLARVLVKMRQGGVSNISLKNRIVANRLDRLAWSNNGLHPYPWTLMMKPLRKMSQWLVRTKDSKQ